MNKSPKKSNQMILRDVPDLKLSVTTLVNQITKKRIHTTRFNHLARTIGSATDTNPNTNTNASLYKCTGTIRTCTHTHAAPWAWGENVLWPMCVCACVRTMGNGEILTDNKYIDSSIYTYTPTQVRIGFIRARCYSSYSIYRHTASQRAPIVYREI